MRVLIVEDQVMLRDSLAVAISAQDDMEVVGKLANASKALELVERQGVELVLMDVCTENDMSGIAATRIIKEAHPEVRVVIMTGMPEVTFVSQARDAHADSFVYKNVSTSELLSVMRSTMEGYSTYPATRRELPGYMDLTDEELQILRLVCETKSRKEIAAELLLSEGTVKRRISDILAKTGYDSVMKLAVHAVSNGWIVPGIKES